MIRTFFTSTLLATIRIYQDGIAPLFSLGKSCRFYPSCSDYSKEAIGKYGPMKGLFKSTTRIMRCNPLCKGGVDLP